MDWQDRTQKTLVLLGRDGTVKLGDQMHALHYDVQHREYYGERFECIKQMYSDHFLVGSSQSESPDGIGFTVHLRLLHNRGFTVYSIVQIPFPNQQARPTPKRIRLLRPRVHVELALVEQPETLCLVGITNRKLQLISRSVLSQSSPPSYLRDGQWIIACQDCITSFEIVLPTLLMNA